MLIRRGHIKSSSPVDKQFSCVCSFDLSRVVDVGSEWRTFSNEKSTSDPSRVGAAQVGLKAKDKCHQNLISPHYTLMRVKKVSNRYYKNQLLT